MDGDLKGDGVMRVSIRDGAEVQVHFKDVPNCISKLIGKFFILNADESDQKDTTRTATPSQISEMKPERFTEAEEEQDLLNH